MSCTCETLEAKLLQIEQLIQTQNTTIQQLQTANASLTQRVEVLEQLTSEPIDITNAIKQAFGIS